MVVTVIQRGCLASAGLGALARLKSDIYSELINQPLAFFDLVIFNPWIPIIG